MNRRLRNNTDPNGMLAKVVSDARDSHRHNGGGRVASDASERHGGADAAAPCLERVSDVCALLAMTVAERADCHVVAKPEVQALIEVVHSSVGMAADGVKADGLGLSRTTEQQKQHVPHTSSYVTQG